MTAVTFVKGRVQWEVTVQPSGRLVGVCEPLGVSLEGYDMNDLHASIHETIQLIMSDLLQNGELDSFLRERGWQAAALPAPGHEPITFEPPIELLIQQATARDRERAAHQ